MVTGLGTTGMDLFLAHTGSIFAYTQHLDG